MRPVLAMRPALAMHPVPTRLEWLPIIIADSTDEGAASATILLEPRSVPCYVSCIIMCYTVLHCGAQSVKRYFVCSLPPRHIFNVHFEKC